MSSLGQGVNINESMKLQKALQKYEEIKVSSLDSFIDPVWNPVETCSAVLHILITFRFGNSIHFSDVFSASYLTPRTVAADVACNAVVFPIQ